MFFNEVFHKVVGRHFDRGGETFEPFWYRFIFFIGTSVNINPDLLKCASKLSKSHHLCIKWQKKRTI
jgi:hypothetical protein